MAKRVQATKRSANWWTAVWMGRLEESLEKEQISTGRRLAKRAQVTMTAGRLRGKISYSSKPSSRASFQFVKLTAKARRAVTEYIGRESTVVAKLMDGELSRELYDALHDRGIELIPPFAHALGDDECTWHRRFYWTDNIDCRPPCQHQIAVWVAAGLLIDSDPFLLLELSGIDRNSILEASRAAGATAGATRGGRGISGDALRNYWTWPYDAAVHVAGRDRQPGDLGCPGTVESLEPPDTTALGQVFRHRLIGLLRAIEAQSGVTSGGISGVTAQAPTPGGSGGAP